MENPIDLFFNIFKYFQSNSMKNPVAKFCRRLNKSRIFRDRKKEAKNEATTTNQKNTTGMATIRD